MRCFKLFNLIFILIFFNPSYASNYVTVGLNSSVTYISSGVNQGNFAEVHTDVDNNFWLSLIKADYDSFNVLSIKSVNANLIEGSSFSIVYLPSGQYQGDLAIAYGCDTGQIDSLCIGIIDMNANMVKQYQFGYGDQASITYISNGDYQGSLAIVSGFGADGTVGALSFYIVSQNDIANNIAVSPVNSGYVQGNTPSIAYISNGPFKGNFAEVHIGSDGGPNINFGVLQPDGSYIIKPKTIDTGVLSLSSLVYIEDGSEKGYVAQVHESQGFDTGTYLDLIELIKGNTTEQNDATLAQSIFYGHGNSPSVTYISTGNLKGSLAEVHVSDGPHFISNIDIWFDLISLD